VFFSFDPSIVGVSRHAAKSVRVAASIGGVDDITELEGPIPYAAPLKGIQVKIRVFEPDSRQIREITVVQSFLWERGEG